MSGTLSSMYNNVSYSLSSHMRAISRLQEQAATGSRVNRASDAPFDAYRVLGLDSQERDLSSYIRNLDDMTNTLEFSSSIVEDMLSSVADVHTQLTQITSGTYNEEDRQRMAEGFNDIIEQTLSLANTKYKDQYLFSGDSTAKTPYVAVRDDQGRIVGIEYQGSDQTRTTTVAAGVADSPYFVGSEVFGGRGSGQVEFLGDTGVKAGTGTSSTAGYTWLDVTYNETDEVYELSIDGGQTKIQADGTDNQAITHGQTGDVLYVDTTSISQTGTELVSTQGSHDVFETLITTRDILQNDRGLSETQIKQMRNHSLKALDEVKKTLSNQTVRTGAKIGFLDNLKHNLDNMQFNAESEKATISEADIAQVVIDMTRHQNLYQMSLAVAGNMMSMSLLNYI